MKTVLSLFFVGATVFSTYGHEATISSKNLQQQKRDLPEITSACNSVDWSCGETFVVCGEGGPYGNCICAGDITGRTQCVQDRPCTLNVPCSEAGECPSGMVCLNSENCCGKTNCVPLCSNTTTTTKSPATRTTTSRSPTPAPNICSGGPWGCGAQNSCGDLGPYGACFCSTDVTGASQCFMEEACATQTICTRNSDCPADSSCISNTCCGSYSLCLPLCVNSSTTTTTPTRRSVPTPAPTPSPAPAICNAENWSCGQSVTNCGSEGPLGCYCNQDHLNNHVCIEDDYCDDVAFCSANTDCQSGAVCVTTCCGSGNCFNLCDNDQLADPLSRLLTITAFSLPSEQEKLCAKSYFDCRETCSQQFGRCTALHGECTPMSLRCLEQCKKTRAECLY